MKEGELLPLGVIDSHAHYFDRKYGQDGNPDADEILQGEVFGKGVAAVINAATNFSTAQLCIAQAKRYPNMYVTVGIHPEDCRDLGDPDEEIGRIRSLADTPEKRAESKIVAIGEIGLDYYWEPYDKKKQAAYFEGQLRLARELGLPVVIHDRDAHGDCFETVLRYPDVTGVFHSFSGSAEMARELCRRGWYISFSGVLTFKNGRRAREAALAVPKDRILIETDAPYLSPEPFRGRLNHSGRVIHVAAVLGELLGISCEEAVALTAENTRRLFGIPQK